MKFKNKETEILFEEVNSSSTGTKCRQLASDLSEIVKDRSEAKKLLAKTIKRNAFDQGDFEGTLKKQNAKFLIQLGYERLLEKADLEEVAGAFLEKYSSRG